MDKPDVDHHNLTIDAPKKLVSINLLSKQSLVEEITDNLPNLRDQLSLTEDDYARGEALNLRLFGFENCPYFKQGELAALLSKALPVHLLTDKQHIKGIRYIDQVLIPQTTEDGRLSDEKVLDEADVNNQFVRTLCIKKHSEPYVTLYSSSGLSEIPEVLKLVSLHALVHDFGHGVIDYYFDIAENSELPDATTDEALNWIIKSALIFGLGTPLSDKSAAYLIDEDAVAQAESEHELAQIVIERSQEDFAEGIRLRALNLPNFESICAQTQNERKRKYINSLWDNNYFEDSPLLP